jgi:hypothetical protein
MWGLSMRGFRCNGSKLPINNITNNITDRVCVHHTSTDSCTDSGTYPSTDSNAIPSTHSVTHANAIPSTHSITDSNAFPITHSITNSNAIPSTKPSAIHNTNIKHPNTHTNNDLHSHRDGASSRHVAATAV